MRKNQILNPLGHRHSLFLSLILPINIFWLILFFLGYPLPHIDDLAFTGAAVNLARNGDYFNPLLAVWNERLLERFYIQPPFSQYTLAAWLWLFGVSTRSFLLFQCLCYNIFSIFTALIFRKYGFSKIATAFTIVCFAFWMLNVGLRCEALGMAFLAVGVWSLTKDTPLRYFWGFFFLGASILTTPISLAYAVPFGLAIAKVNWDSAASINRSYLQQRIGAWLAAFSLNSLLFLVCIKFQLSLFIQDMAWHSSFRRAPFQQAFAEILFLMQHGYGELIYSSLFLCHFCLCLVVLVRRKKFSKKLVAIVILMNLGIALNFFIYFRAITGAISFFSWVCITLILDEITYKHSPFRLLVTSLVTIVFFLNQSLTIVTLAGIHQEPQSSYQEISNYVRSHPNQNYAIDSIAARFVFDYHLPPRSIDWSFSNRAPLFWPTSLSQKPPNRTWIISSFSTTFMPETPDIPKIKLLGRTFNTLSSHPYHVMIIE
ncbi:hypothetical protein [Oscillatoria sp. FACHB-1406]|uniref:hypothetical protein n=1 Tax=Oscillatoria sp. FACHB-1406 TaxID=2692846 RepID=UPI00168695D6|nr:hypothetical protein [Oscillatoria sp. FACHB-1406]MBD2579789.1 hypothetical protein [Oscillatoria sp. FACHB-1406]